MIDMVNDLFAEALFASDLQPSQPAPTMLIRDEITRTLLRHGAGGCAAAVATEFGDHPESAVVRMTWVRHALSTTFPSLTSPREPQLTS